MGVGLELGAQVHMVLELGAVDMGAVHLLLWLVALDSVAVAEILIP
jgi:hypothetical protein